MNIVSGQDYPTNKKRSDNYYHAVYPSVEDRFVPPDDNKACPIIGVPLFIMPSFALCTLCRVFMLDANERR
jgi:hypothetical protein